MRRGARHAHLMLGHAEPEATWRAQTALAAQVLGLSATAVEGIGAMARLRGQLAHAYWELDEAALAPVEPAFTARAGTSGRTRQSFCPGGTGAMATSPVEGGVSSWCNLRVSALAVDFLLATSDSHTHR